MARAHTESRHTQTCSFILAYTGRAEGSWVQAMEDGYALELPMRLRGRDEPVGAARSLLQPARLTNPAVHADCFLERVGRWVPDSPARGTGALLGPPSYSPFLEGNAANFLACSAAEADSCFSAACLSVRGSFAAVCGFVLLFCWYYQVEGVALKWK